MNCPICRKPNECGIASRPDATDCWCFHLPMPEALLHKVPPELQNKVCICRSCAEAALRSE
jgi:hypothetical protein